MVRFFAVPVWALIKKRNLKEPDELQPVGRVDASEALYRCEYRDGTVLEQVKKKLLDQTGPVVFAQPPNDLPALLRTADQLLLLSKQQVGEKSRVWRCDCGTHYSVPMALVRPVAIRCDRCGRTLELEVGKSLDANDASFDDDGSRKLASSRLALADFFREAMARGWPVLVTDEAAPQATET